MRKVLRNTLTRDGRSAVLITHDLLDVLTLADRVLILESGKVAETGSTASILATPRSHFGARFAGVNLVSGTAGPDGALTTEWGTAWHGTPGAGPRRRTALRSPCSRLPPSRCTATSRTAVRATPSR